MIFAEQLRKLNACTNAVEWVGDRTLGQAWRASQGGATVGPYGR